MQAGVHTFHVCACVGSVSALASGISVVCIEPTKINKHTEAKREREGESAENVVSFLPGGFVCACV